MEYYYVSKSEWFKIVKEFSNVDYKGNIFHEIECLIPDDTLGVIVSSKNGTPILSSLFIKRRKHLFTLLDSYIPDMPFLGLRLQSKLSLRAYMDAVKVFENAVFKKASIVRLVNHPVINDVRPFIWRGWNIIVQYTYITYPDRLDLKSLPKDARWLIRKGLKRDIEYVESSKTSDIEHFTRLLEEVMSRKNVEYNLSVVRRHLECILNSGKGRLYFAISRDTNEVIAGEFFLIDESRREAYRLYAASTVQARRDGIAAALLYKTLSSLKEESSVRKVYMLGANVPSLSYFVEDYAHTVEPYYILVKGKSILNTILKHYST